MLTENLRKLSKLIPKGMQLVLTRHKGVGEPVVGVRAPSISGKKAVAKVATSPDHLLAMIDRLRRPAGAPPISWPEASKRSLLSALKGPLGAGLAFADPGAKPRQPLPIPPALSVLLPEGCQLLASTPIAGRPATIRMRGILPEQYRRPSAQQRMDVFVRTWADLVPAAERCSSWLLAQTSGRVGQWPPGNKAELLTLCSQDGAGLHLPFEAVVRNPLDQLKPLLPADIYAVLSPLRDGGTALILKTSGRGAKAISASCAHLGQLNDKLKELAARHNLRPGVTPIVVTSDVMVPESVAAEIDAAGLPLSGAFVDNPNKAPIRRLAAALPDDITCTTSRWRKGNSGSDFVKLLTKSVSPRRNRTARTPADLIAAIQSLSSMWDALDPAKREFLERVASGDVVLELPWYPAPLSRKRTSRART